MAGRYLGAHRSTQSRGPHRFLTSGRGRRAAIHKLGCAAARRDDTERVAVPEMSDPNCQAENCRANLAAAKPYYRRHRVCELHSKDPTVLVAGEFQRFCQQCSRFHLLTEFDDVKKSCRRSLAGHNERRRRVPSESQEQGSNSGPNDGMGGGYLF